MADLIAILKGQEFFFILYNEAKRLAEESRPLENSSATRIQRLFRGVCIRSSIKHKSDAATEVKRAYRGYEGRKQARIRLQEKIDFRQASLFQYFAIQIQRCFRGYYSRKYLSDHSARRSYFKSIADKNQEVLDMMAEYALVQMTRDEQHSQKEKEKEFHDHAVNLHHLLSTANTRGVYKPLERHMEASTPYDISKGDKIREIMLHKILIAGKDDFLAGGKINNLINNLRPLASHGEPYMDPGSNPFLVRGVPENQKELNDSKVLQKPLFVRPTKVPYFTSTGGNKSTVLPNDDFDVIAEAEETGGSIHRNLGLSVRFGVSDCSDNRVPGGTIPMVQPRLSAVKHTKRLTTKRRTHVIKTRLLHQENVLREEYSGSSSDEGD